MNHLVLRSPSAPRLPSLSRGRVHAARGLAAHGQRQIPHSACGSVRHDMNSVMPSGARNLAAHRAGPPRGARGDMAAPWTSAATTSHATAGRRHGGPVAPGATHVTPSPSAARLPSLSRGRAGSARGLAAHGQRQIPHSACGSVRHDMNHVIPSGARNLAAHRAGPPRHDDQPRHDGPAPPHVIPFPIADFGLQIAAHGVTMSDDGNDNAELPTGFGIIPSGARNLAARCAEDPSLRSG